MTHKVIVKICYFIFQLEPYNLGCYIRDVINYCFSALVTS